jgi:hypothetical protein
MEHGTQQHKPKENKTIVSFKNSFWLVIILVGLFISALNFIQAQKGGEEGEASEKTEMKTTGEAKSGNPANKAGEAKPAETAPATEKPAGEAK